MKTIIAMFVLLVGICMSTYAQEINDKGQVTLQLTDMTVDQFRQLQTVKAKEAENLNTTAKTLEKYASWVGKDGATIGTQIKEALLAVVDVAEKFGTTRVGTFVMAMVAWSVMGESIVKILFGIVMLIIITYLVFKNHKEYLHRRVVTKSNGWKFWLEREYTVIEGSSETEGVGLIRFVHLVALILAYCIIMAIMF